MTAGSKSRARAVADPGGGRILGVVEIAAPAARVFRALTSGDEIVRWWGSPETYRTTEWVADVRPGGRWRAGGGSPATPRRSQSFVISFAASFRRQPGYVLT
jgi:uncharacterized protein YndB with AHSA1/START domain